MTAAFLGITVDSEINLGDLIVGLGTGLLAGFTGWLAYQTRKAVGYTKRSVAASEQEIKLARQNIEAQDRPFVIPTRQMERIKDVNHTLIREEPIPIRFINPEQRDHWRFQVRLWNMGKGPAVVTGIFITERVPPRRQVLAELDGEIAIHAPHGVSDRHFDLTTPTQLPEPSEDALWRLRIAYRDATGVEYETTSLLQVSDDLTCSCIDFRQSRTAQLPS